MPDITCCYGKDIDITEKKDGKFRTSNICPLRDNCYRYTVTPDKHYHSYFVGVPYDKKKKSCKYYWTNEPDPLDAA
mgnify:CR=1 FL=1